MGSIIGKVQNIPNVNDLQRQIDDLKDKTDDLETSKQDQLISGRNIKTLNGEPLLGEGNISTKPIFIHNITENGSDDLVIYNGVVVAHTRPLTSKEYVDARDAELQAQIDKIEDRTNLVDIVATYAELEAYDTSDLSADDVIEVLHDETQNEATTYYRWIILLGGENHWELIGVVGPYVTLHNAETIDAHKTFTAGITTSVINGLEAPVFNNNAANKAYVDAETARAISEEGRIELKAESLVSAEETAREVAITNEATARSEADTAEAQTRASADTTLSNALTQEIADRIAGDTALGNRIDHLDYTNPNEAPGKYISSVSQTDGLISTSVTAFDTSINVNTALDTNAPTTKAVKDYTEASIIAEDNLVVHKGSQLEPSVETIYGTKTFKSEQIFDAGINLHNQDITNVDDLFAQDIKVDGDIAIKDSNKFKLSFDGNDPYLFITGNLTDGTNSLSVAQLAAKADDNTVVHLAGTETISGAKSFTSTIEVTNSASGSSLRKVQIFDHEINFYAGNTIAGIQYDDTSSSDGIRICGANLVSKDGDKDLGTSTHQWRNLYLSGNLSDGTNSTTIENIVTKTGTQDISGIKTFASDALRVTDIKSSGGILMMQQRASNQNGFIFNGTIEPARNNNYDIGSSSKLVKDIYVCGNLKDSNSNSVSIANITSHIANISNPHSVTKAQVNLGNVVNTADSAVPVQNGDTKFTTGGAYTLKTDLEAADTALQGNINTVDDKLDANVHIEGASPEITYSGDTVTKISPYKNLKTGSTGTRSEVIQLANATTAGLMSYSDYNQIRINSDRIASLEGTSVRLAYSATTTPTPAQIKTFVDDYLATRGIPSPTDYDYNGVSVRVAGVNHIWNYYANLQAYQDDGLDTVSIFTNSIAGIIKGSPDTVTSGVHVNAGKVYAESDGTGSVIGWSALDTRVGNNESDISSLQSGKVDKLTSGNKVYIHNGSTQTDLAYTTADTASTIVERDANKQISIAEIPTQDYHAASKKYVDGKTDFKDHITIGNTTLTETQLQKLLALLIAMEVEGE